MVPAESSWGRQRGWSRVGGAQHIAVTNGGWPADRARPPGGQNASPGSPHREKAEGGSEQH